MDVPNPSKLLIRILAALSIVTLTCSSASARILFQNDIEFEMDADNLVINADNDVTTGTVYVKFNNSGTAGENGTITWDIDNQKFIIANDIDFTGQLNASAAAGVRIREVADVQDGVTACANENEIAMDTGEKIIYVCTDAANDLWTKISANATVTYGAADPTCDAGATGDLFYNTTDEEVKYCDGTTWQTVGPQDFEQVFANDADGTLTTGNQNFTVNTGTQNFNVSNSGQINFDTGTFDIDATTFDVTATTQTFVGTNISFDADDWDITDAGVATFVTTNTTNLNANNITATNTNSTNITATNTNSTNITATNTNSTNITAVNTNTNNLTATNNVNFSSAASVRTREVSDIATAACTAVGDIVLDTSTNKLYTCTATGTPGTFKSLGGSKTTQLVFNPEYPNAVIDEATGTGTNKGTLSTIFEDATNRQHYNWITTRTALQDMNIKFKIVLPDDFRSFGTMTVDYKTNTGTAADNNVDITVRNITNLASPVTCATVTGLANAAWTTNTITSSTLTTGCAAATAGSVIEVTLNVAATDGDFANIGQVKLNYNN